MNVGDLVILRGTLFSSWEHTNESGIIIKVSDDNDAGEFLVMFGNGDILDFTGYKDHFELFS